MTTATSWVHDVRDAHDVRDVDIVRRAADGARVFEEAC